MLYLSTSVYHNTYFFSADRHIDLHNHY